MIKPQKEAASQTERVLSTDDEKTEKPVKSSPQLQVRSGTAKNNEPGAKAQE